MISIIKRRRLEARSARRMRYLKIAGWAAAAFMFVNSLPDLVRYLKMERM